MPDTPALERGWLYRRLSADTQGKFSLNGIAPGKYRLYAVEQMDNGSESDPEWLRIHQSRSIPVMIEENSALQLQLKRTSSDQLADDERTAGQ